jgi:histidinol dehydrogenase
VRCERLPLSGDPGALAGRIRDLVPTPGSVQLSVAEIINQVRNGRDDAVLEYTRRFDTAGAEAKALRVEDGAPVEALKRLDPAVRAGLERAIDNIGAVAAEAAAQFADRTAVSLGAHEVTLRSTPVDRAAVYVPGGRAPYPSTVVMGVVTARAAGVEDIAVCAPPGAEGELHPTILGACALTGATRVYRMGGAQAIAALAYGTESVARVDVIVGPGNLYVQEAKRQLSGVVGIDGFAGPSDLLVVADHGVLADADAIALDLLAQAEHGPGTLVVAVSPDGELLDALGRRLADAPDTGAVAALVDTEDVSSAGRLAQEFAPEHIELIGPAAEALAPSITHAGCVFVGAHAATAFGDYIAGSNHVLPTNGAARFASSLSPGHFRRSFTEVRIDDPAALARAAAPVARAEGFEFHAESMEARIRDNGSGPQ